MRSAGKGNIAVITFTPSVGFVNDIINAPGVRATVEQGAYRLDASRVLEQPQNAVIGWWGGVAVFEHVERGSFEGHVFCLPGCRGAKALQFGRLALDWLFGTVGASKLTAPVPVQLPAARIYCRRLGLRPVARDLFQEYFEVEAQQWVD